MNLPTPVVQGAPGVATAPTQPDENPHQMQALDLLEELTKARAEVAQLKAQVEVLRDQDPLTGLPNRIRLADRTGQAILRARRQGNMVAILFIELDRFKAINQTLGFAEADELCLQLTRRMAVLLGPGDTLARVGSDQFAVLLPEVMDALEPLRMAQSLLDAIRIPFRVGPSGRCGSPPASASASRPRTGTTPPPCRRRPRTPPTGPRPAGGNTIQCTTLTLSEASFERQQMEAYLGEAILKNEMQIFYQPQATADGTIFGMEALLRWEHPVLGAVPPSKFVPLAEENLLIHTMGEWILATACRQAALWQAMSPRPLKLAVNVSPDPADPPRLGGLVARTLRESRLSPSCLELEITESTLLKNARTSQAILQDLKALGVQLRHRRLRHRLLLPELPAAPAHRHPEDRPGLRARHVPQPARACISSNAHRADHREPGPEHGHAGGGRRGGDRRAEGGPPGHGLHGFQGYLTGPPHGGRRS